MEMTLLMSLLPVAMAAIGEAVAAGDDARAEQLRKEAMAQYNIEIPPAREVHAAVLQSQAQTAHSAPAQATRLESLRMLGERANEGYNDTDRAAINDALSEVSQQERGSRLAIEQNMDPNSGAAIAAKMGNQQAAAQRAHSQGLNIAAGGRANAMKALQMQTQLAGEMEDDEFQRGQAGDAMSQFNERNRVGAQQWNAGQEQGQYDNEFQMANAKAGGLRDESDFMRQKANRKRGQWTGVGTSLQQGIYGATKAGGK